MASQRNRPFAAKPAARRDALATATYRSPVGKDHPHQPKRPLAAGRRLNQENHVHHSPRLPLRPHGKNSEAVERSRSADVKFHFARLFAALALACSLALPLAACNNASNAPVEAPSGQAAATIEELPAYDGELSVEVNRGTAGLHRTRIGARSRRQAVRRLQPP